MKVIKAVSPYVYAGKMNFKDKPFEAWREIGGDTTNGLYPRALHKIMFDYDLPTLCQGEARLCFVQPVSLYFDTFFAAINHEIIPFIWDCWPCYYDKMERWLRKHKVRTAIFTSRQEMEEMNRRLPELNTLWCPEGIDSENYPEGKPLAERSIDLLEFGRSNEKVLGKDFSLNGGIMGDFHHVATKVGDKFLYSNDQLHNLMQDSKITICLPRSMTNPEIAGNVETLTQRYWEAMLSRMLIIGHCPKELEDIIGYNPVIGIDSLHIQGGLEHIISNIADYQYLVDKNRQVALEKGDWKARMKNVLNWLNEQ